MENKKYCSKCGKELRINVCFCPKCGHQINNEKSKNLIKDRVIKEKDVVFKRRLILGIIAAFVILSIVLYIYIIASKPSNNSKSLVNSRSSDIKYGTENPTTVMTTPKVTPTTKAEIESDLAELYNIQLGAFGEKENADKCMSKATISGLSNVRMETTHSGNRTLYCVKVTGFQNKSKAEEKLSEIQASGFSDAFVEKN